MQSRGAFVGSYIHSKENSSAQQNELKAKKKGRCVMTQDLEKQRKVGVRVG